MYGESSPSLWQKDVEDPRNLCLTLGECPERHVVKWQSQSDVGLAGSSDLDQLLYFSLYRRGTVCDYRPRRSGSPETEAGVGVCRTVFDLGETTFT